MDIESLRKMIAFIDVEASGLMTGAFPVEAAWSTSEAAGEVVVNPSGSWDETKWDSDAETMHGLSLAEIKRRGRHPKIAAANLEAALKGRLAFSDSPARDADWADMIHAAGGVPRTYRIETVGRLLGHLGVRASRAYEIFKEARASHPPRGRARNGVAHLEAVFEAAIKESAS